MPIRRCDASRGKRPRMWKWPQRVAIGSKRTHPRDARPTAAEWRSRLYGKAFLRFIATGTGQAAVRAVGETRRLRDTRRSLQNARRTETIVACWSRPVKRKRALLESNTPRNSWLETQYNDDLSRAGGGEPPSVLPSDIRSPHALKTHADFSSNSTGVRYFSAECSRRWL
jgi:hypothetical protein